MKISDLLGEGWESDERSEADPEARAAGPITAPPVPPNDINAPAEQIASPSPDVSDALASWGPAPEPPAPEPTAPEPTEPDVAPPPANARAQLADLAAELATPITPVASPVEPAVFEEAAELARLTLVVDDLLPDATKRSATSRGSSRSGSRRRAR